MRTPPLALAIGLSLGLSFSAVAPLAIAADAKPAAAKPAAAKPAAARPAAPKAPKVEPAAVQALQRMSAYLSTLTSFEAKAETSLDLVDDNDQTLQLDGVTRYKVRAPDGFVIEVVSDRQSRQFIYDGKQLTVNSPNLGFYATVPAPPTIRKTLEAAYDKYGIQLPLEDLFRWADPANKRSEDLTSGFVVGTATIDGAETTQYAFREGGTDWQIWIQKGDHPLPRRLVIATKSDEARPQHTAEYTWNLAPSFNDAAFVFDPPEGAGKVVLAKAAAAESK